MILILLLNLFMGYLGYILVWFVIMWMYNLNRSKAMCSWMLLRDILEYPVPWGPLKHQDSMTLMMKTILATFMLKIYASLSEI